jgi:hypothetical protein
VVTGLASTAAESPPIPTNFAEIPIVTWEAYEYSPDAHAVAYADREDVFVGSDGEIDGAPQSVVSGEKVQNK